MMMEGHARDVMTSSADIAPTVIAEDRYTLVASPVREILSLAVTPDRPHAQQLIGMRGGGQSRAALNQIMAQERIAGTPLYLILDDFAGASLVCNWIWSRWAKDWNAVAMASGMQSTAGRGGNMEGVCTGFAPGSSALIGEDGGTMRDQSYAPVASLVNPDDPEGWHDLGEQDGVGMRRARRIDVWRDGEAIIIDIGFQDSGTSPDGGDRLAVHEYHVRARAENDVLTELTIDPRILPFVECPGAVLQAHRVLRTPLKGLRSTVLETLPGTLGCTHLNDVLRSMAEVPAMAAHLPK